MKQTLLSIQNKIAEVTQLKYVDEDWGQLDYYSPNPPVKWPCALIDIGTVTFDNIGRDRTADPKNRQTGQGIVNITVANVQLSNSSFNAPLSQKNNAFATHTIINEIHKKIHGWSPDGASALIRTNLSRTKRDDGIQEYNISYSFGLTHV